MPGNRNARLILTERDRALLKEIAVARVVDRELVKQIAGFQATPTVNARLLKLVRCRLLKRFFVGTEAGGRKALYSLSFKGSAAVGTSIQPVQRKRDALLVGDGFVQHRLVVNAIWAKLRFTPVPVPQVSFVRWIFIPTFISKSVPLIPDGYFELRTPSELLSMFCEVDQGTETLKTWARKVRLYLQLAVSGEFQHNFHNSRFRVLVIADSDRRLRTIRREVARHTRKLFWFTTLEAINRENLFSTIWLRPTGEERQSLL